MDRSHRGCDSGRAGRGGLKGWRHSMIRSFALAPILLSTAVLTMTAQSFPETEISNGVIHAKVYLPDPEHGYYRGSRFDWAGVIASLICGGHEYFGHVV